jgi:cation:H+ antiporter
LPAPLRVRTLPPMLNSLVMLIAGLVALYFGAEWLVSGSSGLARSLGIPGLIVGLTVVAYGTSAPEIVVGIQASLGGHGDIALGNVVGSNIANLGLILGISALLKPARVDGSLILREVPMLVFTALAVPVILADGVAAAWEGLLLLAGAVGYTLWMVRDARRSIKESRASLVATSEAAGVAGGGTSTTNRPRLVVLTVLGLVLLVGGGSLFVEGATQLALTLGMSERLVGLTIVAVGTSLPELATSLLAAWRGHSDIAVGNVVGSNIFNVLACLGGAAVVAPLHVAPGAMVEDLTFMVGMTVAGAFMIRKDRHVTRLEGLILLLAYVGFTASLVWRG